MIPILRRRNLLWVVRLFLVFIATISADLDDSWSDQPPPRVSTVSNNGMPKDIVKPGHQWNFGPGSLWTHQGWQYAAYWDESKQVSVARRELPTGKWEVASLNGYRRSSSGNRGKGGKTSRGFGDGHEKVAMGIYPDGVIHLAFDHHVSTLHYRVSKAPVANDPADHEWNADLFSRGYDNLGGSRIDSVTYPAFTRDDDRLTLYLRLGGGSGSADSHYFDYARGRWTADTTSRKLIDKNWSGGDRTVNAYPHGLVIRDGRRHLTWSWRDTPDATTSHDLCYAYSDDHGRTWKNNDGRRIGRIGQHFITSDSRDVAVVRIAPGTRYVNGGSMTVDQNGRVHVLMRGENGSPAYFTRDSKTKTWSRATATTSGHLVAGAEDWLYVVAPEGMWRTSASNFGPLEVVLRGNDKLFVDSKMGIDRTRVAHDGWVSVIGQQGRRVTVVDYFVGQ